MARAKGKTAHESRAREDGAGGRWSDAVTRFSDALDLEPEVFTWSDPKAIALSLKRSAEESLRRKAPPYQSAMSMLNFYINRAGSNLDRSQKQVLERAKEELRKAFGRASVGAAPAGRGQRRARRRP